MFVLPFYSKSARLLLKLFEFGLNLVMIMKRYIILISDLLRKQLLWPCQEVRMYSHREAAVLFWDINATATTSWPITHAVHILNILTRAN